MWLLIWSLASQITSRSKYSNRDTNSQCTNSSTLNLAILYLTKLVHTKLSNFINLCNQLLAMHFTGLVCTKFSEKNEKAKIIKFSVLLNLQLPEDMKESNWQQCCAQNS